MPIPNPYRVFFKTEALSLSTSAGSNVLELETKCNQIRVFCEAMIATTGNFAALDVTNLVFQYAPRIEGVLVKPRGLITLASPNGSFAPLQFNDEFVLEAPDQSGIIEQKIKVVVPAIGTAYGLSLIVVKRYIQAI